MVFDIDDTFRHPDKWPLLGYCQMVFLAAVLLGSVITS